MRLLGRTRLATAVAVQLGTAAVQAAEGPAAPVPPADENLEEIIVTGSRIQQRLEDAPVPVIIVDRDAIDRASQDSIGVVLQQLPMNNGFAQNTNVNNGGDGTVRINLRDLGPERTLVLVNGHRFVYGGSGGNTSVDVNMIPLSLVERVEVMGTGSSTVYGSDAIGGVVNMITREDYHGAEIKGSYTTNDHDDGTVYDLSFVAGDSNDRGYVSFGMEYVNQHAVFQADRDYSRHTEYLNNNGQIAYAGSPATPDGRFVIAGDNALGLEPGVYTRVAGSGNPPTAADFRPFNATADATHPSDLYDYAPINYLRTPSERQYLWAIGGYDINDHLSVYVNALFHHRDSQQNLAPTPFNSTNFAGGAPKFTRPNGTVTGYIPADNYYNPFGVDLIGGAWRVRRRFVESTDRRFSQDVQTQWYLAGLQGSIGDSSWTWELSADYGRNDTDVTTEGEFRTDRLQLALGHSGLDASGNVVCSRDPVTGVVPGGSIIPGCVPLNLFGGAGSITQPMLDYATTSMTDKGYNAQQAYELIFRGDWGTVQDRPIRWATGISHRVETAAIKVDKQKLAGVAGAIDLNLTGGDTFTADEAYAEASVPLLQGLAGAEALNLTAGLRYSDFSSFGSVTTWQAGIMYRPVRSLTLRASYGTVFRAPPIADLYQANTEAEDFEEDPCGNDPTPQQAENCAAHGVPGGSYVQGGPNETFNSVLGGNKDLQPEEGDSWTAGLTIAPETIPGLEFSADYWSTSLDNIIFAPWASDLLNSCADVGAAEGCSKIYRDPEGFIVSLDLRNANAATATVSGYDFDLGYTLPVAGGHVSARTTATYMSEDDFAPVTGWRFFNEAGRDDISGAVPHWRGLGYVEYSRARWSASYQAQYIGSMRERIGGPGLDRPDQYRGWHDIDARWYQDVRLQCSFESGPTISFAINNLANVDPSWVGNAVGANTDMAAYRLLGRTYYLGMSYRIE